MTGSRRKRAVVDEVIREFRAAGNQDSAFDTVAAERLGVSPTDLHCLNIIENASGLSAGELATRSGLTAGAITGVTDRLERAGLATRVTDPADRRRVRIEVTSLFREIAAEVWGPMAADWHSTLTRRFTADELELIADFLRATNEIGRRQLRRLRAT